MLADVAFFISSAVKLSWVRILVKYIHDKAIKLAKNKVKYALFILYKKENLKV
jgi:hypothetical protein